MQRFLTLCFLLLSFQAAFAQTILEVAADDPGLSTFVAAVEQAGLTEALNSEGPFTIFAPTNAAFMQIPGSELMALLEDQATLERILTYHVVPAFVMARDAVSATSAPTLEGSEISVRVESGNLLINESKVVKFDVGATENVQASNGIIHVIDSVLTPMGVMLGQVTAPVRIGAPVSLVQEVEQVYQTAAQQSVRYRVGAVDGSGVSGSVLVADYGYENAVVTVLLTGTPPNGDHPAHFHAGDCGSSGDIVVPLENVSGASGLSVTTASAPYNAVSERDHYLNIHLSPDDMATIMACGEAGLNAN